MTITHDIATVSLRDLKNRLEEQLKELDRPAHAEEHRDRWRYIENLLRDHASVAHIAASSFNAVVPQARPTHKEA